MLYISQTVIEFYTPCVPLYSNVNLVKRWISSQSLSQIDMLPAMIFDVVYVHSVCMSQYYIKMKL